MTFRDGARKRVRSAFEQLPDGVRTDLLRKRLELRGLGQVKINQALLAQRLAELEKRAGLGPQQTPDVEDPRFPPLVRSKLCTQAQLDEPWFADWCAELHEPRVAHRKAWEFAYIAEVLEQMGVLSSGRTGLGFGVGREPLVPAFAARGASIVATDIGSEDSEALGWARSGQHATTVEAMMRPEICDPDTFRERVTWRPVDMRAIPSDLRGFDFCWSACALEHLGTLDEGMRFIEESVATLAPGGVAVHTTEFNVNSNDDTIESGPTVIYRERDVLELRDRLEAAGHEVAAFDFSRGDGLLDLYVDVPPYSDEPVLRFLAGRYTLTSIAIIVRAGGAPAA